MISNTFMWFVPRDWDSSQITRFTQHAASVGAADFPLLMDLSTRVDGPGYKCYPHAPLEEDVCRANLERWMRTVYYGVETRVLVNDWPLRRDDGLIAHFLHQAQQVSSSSSRNPIFLATRSFSSCGCSVAHSATILVSATG